MVNGRSGRTPGRTTLGLVCWAALALVAWTDGLHAADPESTRGKPASVLSAVDTLISEAWENAGIKPSKVATEPEFLRRAYLDILGRIPSVRESLEYLSSKDPARRAKLVEALLAHPDYAKNFATIWTVVLTGRRNLEGRADRDALRSWLRRQFAEDRPWNDVSSDLITASGSNKENGAVNFTLAHLQGDAVPLTSFTTRVFLGQQVQCTQCHDHPSNDWKQADFWGINAFFRGVRSREVRTSNATGAVAYDYTELTEEPTDAFATYEKRNALVGIAFPTFLDGRKISQGTDVVRREELSKFVTARENLDFARAFANRTWGHFFGRGFVNPLDDFGPHNPPSHPEALDLLARHFIESNYDVKALIRLVTSTRAYHLSSQTLPANEKDDSLFSHMALKPMSPEQLFESLLIATSAHKAGGQGDSDRRRQDWLGQFIYAFANDEGEEASSFQGTIPQALMMMNGELMERAVNGSPGSFLADLVDQARLQKRSAPELFVVNHLYLAALSRYPTARERDAALKFLSSSPDPIPIVEDLFWALLNSNEFVLNR